MSLTIDITPEDVSPVYNPMVFQFDSDVRSDYTIGEVHFLDGAGVTNNNGYVELYDEVHGFIKGDFLKVTDAGGIDYLLGVWEVIEVINVNSYVISAAYQGAGISDIFLYKYYKNYNLVARLFTYNVCNADYQQIAKLLFKPLFEGGYCYFRFDIADIIKNYNNECNTEADDISGDLMPLSNIPTLQVNNKSFVSYYMSYAEGFDNPVGGTPEYSETIPEVD